MGTIEWLSINNVGAMIRNTNTGDGKFLEGLERCIKGRTAAEVNAPVNIQPLKSLAPDSGLRVQTSGFESIVGPGLEDRSKDDIILPITSSVGGRPLDTLRFELKSL